jgi:glycosyltransferase involved in cell wall biosynthesis
MRILTVGNMYPPHHLGGYELIWRNAVRDLRERGHDVTVLTTDFRHPDRPDAREEEPDVHRTLRWWWRDHHFPRHSPLERFAVERHNARILDRHVSHARPDVVSWWSMGGMTLSLIERVRRSGLPAVGFVIDDWLDYAPRVDQWRLLVGRGSIAGAAERLTGVPTHVDLAGAARWLFVSAYTRDRALAARPELARDGDTGLAHAGIDPALATGAPPRDWQGRLLYLGRVDSRKGIDTAIRALAQRPAVETLSVVGDGDEDEVASLRALVAELGLADRVAFEPGQPREALAEVVAAHDAVLFPVRWEEPWGLVPIEAMGCGRPVIATGTGGSAEFLVHGVNCLLTPKDDPAALAERIGRLAADPALRARLHAGGLQTAATYTEAAYHAVVAAEHEHAPRARLTRRPNLEGDRREAASQESAVKLAG